MKGLRKGILAMGLLTAVLGVGAGAASAIWMFAPQAITYQPIPIPVSADATAGSGSISAPSLNGADSGLSLDQYTSYETKTHDSSHPGIHWSDGFSASASLSAAPATGSVLFYSLELKGSLSGIASVSYSGGLAAGSWESGTEIGLPSLSYVNEPKNDDEFKAMRNAVAGSSAIIHFRSSSPELSHLSDYSPSGECSVSSYSGSAASVIVPPFFDGKPVTMIGNTLLSEGSFDSVFAPGLVSSGTFNSTATSVYIPESVKTLGTASFGGCLALTSVDIPESVTRICPYAFALDSALSKIVIPASVTKIEECLFEACTSLTDFRAMGAITEIQAGAFGGCSKLASFDIPDSVAAINEDTFEGCSSLAIVSIGKGVSSIGKDAFSGCAALTNISYDGTVAQWNAMTKGESWHEGVPATTSVTCLDGSAALA
jgi:hypothetical protein